MRLCFTRHTVMLTVTLLGGCASFSPDNGFAPIEQASQQHLGQDVHWNKTDEDRGAVSQKVKALLEKPLRVDDAVQIALLNNPGLQAAFAELGISEADRVQAGHVSNPGISLGRLTRGNETEIETGVHIGLLRLLAMPLTRAMEERRFAQAQQQATLKVLSLAAQTRKAYFTALAAEETLGYTRQVMASAEASAELARRLTKAGNWSRLQLAREQAFQAETALEVVHAEQQRHASREQLIRLLGLWGEQTAFTLPERLPTLPNEVRDLPNVEQLALQQRLDIQAARLSTEQTAGNLGLTRMTRFINVLELGVVRNTSNEEPTQRGYEISFELPLFDWGSARVAKAEAIYMQALYRARETAINARSEVRETYINYRSRYDMARHYRDEILPLQQRISEENVLRYNGMLIGVFELLADARVQVASVNGSIEALRDFWIAQADLDMALIGQPDFMMSAADE